MTVSPPLACDMISFSVVPYVESLITFIRCLVAQSSETGRWWFLGEGCDKLSQGKFAVKVISKTLKQIITIVLLLCLVTHL